MTKEDADFFRASDFVIHAFSAKGAVSKQPGASPQDHYRILNER